MTRSVRRGAIPSEMGWLADWMEDVNEALADLQSPNGTQRAGTVGYLAGLATYAAGGAPTLATGTVPNDNVTRWFATSPDTIVPTIAAPTNKLLVEASCGEASIDPGGSFVVAYVGYSVRDGAGQNVPGHGLGSITGRRYTNQREGIGLTTYRQVVNIDPNVSPAPYTIRAFFGFWASSLNTTACSAQFISPSLVVQVIGEGRSL